VPFAPVITLKNNGTAQVARIEFDLDGDGSPDSVVTNFQGSYSATMGLTQASAFEIGVKVFDISNALIYSGKRWVQAVEPSLVGYRALSSVNGMLDEMSLGNATPRSGTSPAMRAPCTRACLTNGARLFLRWHNS
jgi:hypothetical protein